MVVPRAPIPPGPPPPEVHAQVVDAALEPVDAKQLKHCCSALRQNAKSSPPDQLPGYTLVAATCEALEAERVDRAALRTILSRAPSTPSSCRF